MLKIRLNEQRNNFLLKISLVSKLSVVSDCSANIYKVEFMDFFLFFKK